ncbi:MAG: gluconokinase [Trebonia sp.]
MGVSGCGKSTVGGALAERLGWTFLEADDLHPPANVAKMRSGRPLDDTDRAPWLARLRAAIARYRGRCQPLVLACSALTAAHRDAMTPHGCELVYVHLRGPRPLLEERLAARRGHYMPASLLPSQLQLLEPPGSAITIDIRLPIERQVDAIVAGLRAEAVDTEPRR